MHRTASHLAIAAGLLPLTACASIVSRSEYAVLIDTEPTGAAIEVTNRKGERVHTGTAPTTVSLAADAGFFSSQSYTVNATLDGYETQVSTLKGSMDGWYIGNLLFGGLLGFLIIDPATGAMWKLPDRHELQLYRPGEAPPAPVVTAYDDDDEDF